MFITPQNCTVIVVDSSYIKDYPAPPAEGYNGKERSNIELKIDVMKAGTAHARFLKPFLGLKPRG